MSRFIMGHMFFSLVWFHFGGIIRLVLLILVYMRKNGKLRFSLLMLLLENGNDRGIFSVDPWDRVVSAVQQNVTVKIVPSIV